MDHSTPVYLAIAALLLGSVFLFGRALTRVVLARIGLARWLREPFPEAWRVVLRRNMPLYRVMPREVRLALERKVMRFLAEKTFEACGTLERVTDEVAVTIAGHSCLLIAGRPGEATYPWLSAVLVYPDAFLSTSTRSDSAEARVGESDSRGVVALSWREIRSNIAHSGNGHSVILHEFAHQLDAEDSGMDGMPWIPDEASRESWLHDMRAAYEKLREEGEYGALDDYGALEPAEFFAVATEAFFENAVRFREYHPDLHRHLRNYYRLDPARWF